MKKQTKGFTLIELVVVMAIIAVLSLLIVAAITAARRQSQTTQRMGNLKTIETALESRASKCNGQYFAAVTGKTECSAITTTTIQDINNGLSAASAGFLTQSLGTLSNGYAVGSASATANTFELYACSFPDTTCTSSDAAYVAKR